MIRQRARLNHVLFFFTMRLKIFSACFLALMSLLLAPRAFAQSPIVVASQSVDMLFPRAMRFNLEATSAAPIRTLILTVRQRGAALGSRFAVPFAPATNIRAEFEWSFQSAAAGGYLPPGAEGDYTWHIEDAADNVLDTPRAEYVVTDRAHKWATRANDALSVNWYQGGDDFGSAIFTRAMAAREFLARELGIENIPPLKLFIYATKGEFFTALPPFSAEWTGGRMFPDYGVILINFAPENMEWGLRATSHELSHAILHSKIRGTIGELSVPHWLDEGLAVYNEMNDHAPDEQFERVFLLAARRDTLIPLKKLEQRFPEDTSEAQLAYGQSYSAVKFMIEEYGAAKFSALLDVYERGALPDDGLRQVYDMNQDELENAWRQKIGATPRAISTARMPTVAPRPTFEVSAPLNAPTAISAASLTPTAAPTRVAQTENPAPNASAPALPASGLCGGVVMLSGVAALRALKRRAGKV
jgi:hypothetical protein